MSHSLGPLEHSSIAVCQWAICGLKGGAVHCCGQAQAGQPVAGVAASCRSVSYYQYCGPLLPSLLASSPSELQDLGVTDDKPRRPSLLGLFCLKWWA